MRGHVPDDHVQRAGAVRVHGRLVTLVAKTSGPSEQVIPGVDTVTSPKATYTERDL